MFSEICVLQSLDPICGKFDKFLAHGQAHMGQMGKWPWQCTPTGLDNSTELRTERIHEVVTEIWGSQVWQLLAWPPTRTVTTIPLQPGKSGGRYRVDTISSKDGQCQTRIPLFQLHWSGGYKLTKHIPWYVIYCSHGPAIWVSIVFQSLKCWNNSRLTQNP